jgi:hypothetical protein
MIALLNKLKRMITVSDVTKKGIRAFKRDRRKQCSECRRTNKKQNKNIKQENHYIKVIKDSYSLSKKITPYTPNKQDTNLARTS